jgi:hypothetical protein
VNGPTPSDQPILRPDASRFAKFVVGLVAGRKSIPVVGLFYVPFLNGLAALFIVPFIARAVAFAVAAAVGGGIDMVVTTAVIVCWVVTVPWAIIAARRRNARRGL